MSRAGEGFGICQWFHFGDYRLLDMTLRTLSDLGVRHLRTGLSWADYHRPGGIEWYDWQMERLAGSGLEVLLSVWHTPPSISMDPARGSASVPPARTRDYADFLDTVIGRWGETFEALELWNEPNNPLKWASRYDPDYSRYASLVIDAGNWARQLGKHTVLGGVTLLDLHFIDRMRETGALDHVDVLGIHAFPHMWEPHATDWDHPSHWYGWSHRIRTMSDRADGLPVWVTETGLATVAKDTGRVRYALQVEMLREALCSDAERMYWYSLFDLPPDRPAIEELNGAPREEAEYHMGLIRYRPGFEASGNEKPSFHWLREALADRSSAAAK
jgi:CDP-paratose 2-epimerase